MKVNITLGAQHHQLEAIQRNQAMLGGRGISREPFKTNSQLTCYPGGESLFEPMRSRMPTILVILKQIEHKYWFGR